MRLLAILAVVLTATAVQARPMHTHVVAVPADPDHADFWREMLEPHADEVQRILQLAHTSLQQADSGVYGDYDPTGEQRTKFYRDVYGMVRYAHRLAPDNIEVLKLLAQTADELGKTREALQALDTVVRLQGSDKSGPEVLGRLGTIYARMGRLDEAIHYLRLAQVPVFAATPAVQLVVVHLANALAARGELSDAIDVLSNALPPSVGYYSNELALIGFSLAVQYDRNDERGAAFDVLDHMQSQLQAQQFAAQVQNGFAMMRWAPAEDQHYYQALLYEAMGHYIEARAEWALYIASGDPPFRARAQQHIAAIDADHRPAREPAPATPARHIPIRIGP